MKAINREAAPALNIHEKRENGKRSIELRTSKNHVSSIPGEVNA